MLRQDNGARVIAPRRKTDASICAYAKDSGNFAGMCRTRKREARSPPIRLLIAGMASVNHVADKDGAGAKPSGWCTNKWRVLGSFGRL